MACNAIRTKAIDILKQKIVDHCTSGNDFQELNASVGIIFQKIRSNDTTTCKSHQTNGVCRVCPVLTLLRCHLIVNEPVKRVMFHKN